MLQNWPQRKWRLTSSTKIFLIILILIFLSIKWTCLNFCLLICNKPHKRSVYAHLSETKKRGMVWNPTPWWHTCFHHHGFMCSPTCTQRPPKGRGCWVSWSKVPLWTQPCLWKWASQEHAVSTGSTTVIYSSHNMTHNVHTYKVLMLTKNWTFNILKWKDVVMKWTWNAQRF